MNNKPTLSYTDLKELISDNEVRDFDPVAEAFKVYDPAGTGYVDVATLRTMFQVKFMLFVPRETVPYPYAPRRTLPPRPVDLGARLWRNHKRGRGDLNRNGRP
jgi:hypothetical protein